jgi:signal transduction histidine kinase
MPTLGSSVGSPQVAGARAGMLRLPGRVSALSAPTRFDGAFPPVVRRLGLVYVFLTVPLVTALSATVHGQREYVFAFVFFASGFFTTPALVVAWLGIRRVPAPDRRWLVSWFVGLALTYATGIGMLVGLATGWQTGNRTGGPVVGLIASLFILTSVGLVRSRSGRRTLTVDVLEAAMALVVIMAPCALIWGDRVLEAKAEWFAWPAALALVAVVTGVYWTIALFVRLGPEAGVLEASGIVLTLVGSADAAAQLAQGVSGFTLPAPPLIALHATCMAMLFLVPLHVPRKLGAGLDRLPPQAQVRGGGLVALMTLVGVPVLLGVTAWTAGRDGGSNDWAPAFALGALATLLALGALRHLATVRETRRLYAQVERASDERRALLGRVMERADEDRHRVAAQLHEQAVSAYASFVSFIQACGPGGPAAGVPDSSVNGASTLVRDNLARHADSLRQLMLAIQPLESSVRGSQTLAAPIHAYLDNLYGDRRAPHLTVEVQEGLHLDWINETIALRIVQEAVRNVWRHSEAANVDVSIGMSRTEDGVVVVRVADDGVGFDPEATLFESGIGAMREFAAVLGGSTTVTSAPGAGTTVTAWLGGAVDPDGAPGQPEEDDAAGAEPPASATDEGAQAKARLRLVGSRSVSR